MYCLFRPPGFSACSFAIRHSFLGKWTHLKAKNVSADNREEPPASRNEEAFCVCETNMELEETVETSKHMVFNNPPAALAFASAFDLAAAGAALVLVLAAFLDLSLLLDPLDS